MWYHQQKNPMMHWDAWCTSPIGSIRRPAGWGCNVIMEWIKHSQRLSSGRRMGGQILLTDSIRPAPRPGYKHRDPRICSNTHLGPRSCWCFMYKAQASPSPCSPVGEWAAGQSLADNDRGRGASGRQVIWLPAGALLWPLGALQLFVIGETSASWWAQGTSRESKHIVVITVNCLGWHKVAGWSGTCFGGCFSVPCGHH